MQNINLKKIRGPYFGHRPVLEQGCPLGETTWAALLNFTIWNKNIRDIKRLNFSLYAISHLIRSFL